MGIKTLMLGSAMYLAACAGQNPAINTAYSVFPGENDFVELPNGLVTTQENEDILYKLAESRVYNKRFTHEHFARMDKDVQSQLEFLTEWIKKRIDNGDNVVSDEEMQRLTRRFL